MKIKEIEKTANVAWSPHAQHPVYLAAGTAAQQLDATFSTSSSLEVYALDLVESELPMPLVASISADFRFHKVLWGSHGMTTGDSPSGVIVTGADNGSLVVYDAARIIKQEDNCIVMKKDKHQGALKALDFNPFQPNLLASGAGDSEIFIWDFNKPDSPMTPGTKSQPPEEVTCVAWNKQVQHILASTFNSRCVVFDLRKNEPIIKISDSMSGIKSKLAAWHPEVATQLCLSSEDDHTPVIQLWDLRYATSPLKVFENHKRGILSMAWCPLDPDLLLSCGKDNRILCWNPNSNAQAGEVVCELPTNNQWSFDVQWCPRNPFLISSAFFDGHVSVFSLMGGGHPVTASNKIAESFNTNDAFSQPQMQSPLETDTVKLLQKPPKWLRKPVGASFGFGGKLVSFVHPKPQSQQQPSSRQVFVSQVVTETEFIDRSKQLQQALQNAEFAQFCSMKSENTTENDTMEENIWNFLKVNFESEPRPKFLNLLGYDQTELAKKVADHTGASITVPTVPGVDAAELAKKMSLLSAGDALKASSLVASGQASPSVDSKTPNDVTNDLSDGLTAFDEIASHSQKEVSRPDSPLSIATDDDSDGLMSQALLTGNFEAAVEMCLHANKMTEAILLAIAGGPELLTRTQKKYFHKNKSSVGRLISSVVTRDWTHIVQTCELENWKEALALIITYASSDEFTSLCDSLGTRLETESGSELAHYASLCFICSGNVERLVTNWLKTSEESTSPLALQDLVEKVMMLQKSVEISQGEVKAVGSGSLADKLSLYSSILASQGSFSTAMSYMDIGQSSDLKICILKDRLYQALGLPPGTNAPAFPFQKNDIVAEGAKRAVDASQQQRSRNLSSHQTQAAGGFQTTTTASSSYQNQSGFAASNGPLSSPVHSTPAETGQMQMTPSVQPATSTKSHLSHKYHPQSTSGYSMYSYTQPNFTPADFSQQPAGYSQANSYNYYSGGGYTSEPQPSSQPMGIYNPAAAAASSTGMYQSPGNTGMFQPTTTPAQTPSRSYQEVSSGMAWNDPPIVEKKQTSSTFEPPAAITAPLYEASQGAPEQGPPGAPVNNYSNIYNPQEYQPETRAPQPAAPEPPKPVVKGPIPEEHQIIHDIFNMLINNCMNAATNAQSKRKLEDVARKLEALYDKLRENTLSAGVTHGLHQIILYIQQFDYNSSLATYTQMISQGNFSEISSFMPGLKVLIQTAAHLQVYAQ